MKYGYNYFSGSNVILEIENFPILECAGLSYEIHESKKPIYGYSSRHFDGVARGQVLVTGSFLVNYVHQDYVFSAIQKGIEIKRQNSDPNYIPSGPSDFAVRNELGLALINGDRNKMYASFNEVSDLANSLKAQYWTTDSSTVKLRNPHDIFGGLSIKVTFGYRGPENLNNGLTSTVLSDVYIVGRGTRIPLTEEVVVEEYSFFARNMISGV